MENPTLWENVLAFIGSFKTVDWAAFMLFWLSIERILKLLARITPWSWDDDLVNWLAVTIRNIAPKKPPTP